MTSEFKPLIDDKSRPAYIRDLLRQARNANDPQYDFDAGLVKHKALIASGAPLPEWANSSLTGVTKTTTIIARIVGIASVPVVGGIIAWKAFFASVGDYSSYDTKPIQSAETQQQPSIASAPSAAQLTTDPASQIGATTDIENRPLASIKKPKGEVIKSKASVTRPPRKRLYRRSPSETIARPSVAMVRSPDIEKNDEPTTVGSYATEVATDRQMDEPLALSNFEKASKPIATPPSDDTLQREMKLLAEARRQVKVSPSRSLVLARARHPKTGILSEEWDQVYLLALIKLGRIEEAREGVKRFRNRYPNSAFNERLSKELLPSEQ